MTAVAGCVIELAAVDLGSLTRIAPSSVFGMVLENGGMKLMQGPFSERAGRLSIEERLYLIHIIFLIPLFGPLSSSAELGSPEAINLLSLSSAF